MQQEQQESLQREKEEAQQKERERQAEERHKEEQREEVSCWENLQHHSDFALLCSVLYSSILLYHLGSEAAGSLWAAGEAAESPNRRTEEDVLRSRGLHHHHSAFLSEGSHWNDKCINSILLLNNNATPSSVSSSTLYVFSTKASSDLDLKGDQWSHVDFYLTVSFILSHKCRTHRTYRWTHDHIQYLKRWGKIHSMLSEQHGKWEGSSRVQCVTELVSSRFLCLTEWFSVGCHSCKTVATLSRDCLTSLCHCRECCNHSGLQCRQGWMKCEPVLVVLSSLCWQ